jgi:hypothetical protein
VQRFAPLCEAERGWGEFILLNNSRLHLYGTYFSVYCENQNIFSIFRGEV